MIPTSFGAMPASSWGGLLRHKRTPYERSNTGCGTPHRRPCRAVRHPQRGSHPSRTAATSAATNEETAAHSREEGTAVTGTDRTPQPCSTVPGLDGMDTDHEIREFLATTRRAKITPQQAGLPAFGSGNRRVPGLRREEVALPAGIGIDYGRPRRARSARRRFRRGPRLRRPGPATGRGRTRPPAGPGRPPAPRPGAPRLPQSQPVSARKPPARPGVHDRLPGLHPQRPPGHPRRQPGRALYAPLFTGSHRPVNIARFPVLAPTSRGFFPNWSASVNTTVSLVGAVPGPGPGASAARTWCAAVRGLWRAAGVVVGAGRGPAVR